MAKKAKPKKTPAKKKPAVKKIPTRKVNPIPRGSAEQTPTTVLRGLVKLATDSKSRIKPIRDDIAQAIKDAASVQNLHPAAFRQVLRWIEMGAADPLRLRAFLDAVDHYRDALAVDDLKAPNLIATNKPRGSRPAKASGEMRPLGEVASNVVDLVSSMKQAIDADKGNAPKGEMVG